MRELLGLGNGPGGNGETVRRFGWRAWVGLSVAFVIAALVHATVLVTLQRHVIGALLANQGRMLESQERTVRAVRRLDRSLLQWSGLINDLGVTARGLHEQQRDLEGETQKLRLRQTELEDRMTKIMAEVRKALSEYARALRGHR